MMVFGINFQNEAADSGESNSFLLDALTHISVPARQCPHAASRRATSPSDQSALMGHDAPLDGFSTPPVAVGSSVCSASTARRRASA